MTDAKPRRWRRAIAPLLVLLILGGGGYAAQQRRRDRAERVA